MSGNKIHRASNQPALSQVTRVAAAKVSPIAWAKRLGGPGTDFSQDVRRGPLTWTANQPSGEIFGPAATRAAKP
jgi:hypothetical protein